MCIADFMKLMRQPIQFQVADARSQVLKEACLLLVHIARCLGVGTKGRLNLANLEKFIEYFVSKGCLGKVLHSGNSVMSDVAHSTIKSVISTFRPFFGAPQLMTRIFAYIRELLSSKTT